MCGIISRSFFIIKPEAFAVRKEIVNILNRRSNLTVVETKIIRLTEEDIDVIYLDDIGTPLLKAIKKHLSGKYVEAGIVEGFNAVIELRRICGDCADPNLCEKNTIRHKFGLPEPVQYCNQKFFLNAVHSAIESEVTVTLAWFNSKK